MTFTALIDYGAGNIRSVERALARAGAAVVVTADARTAARADKIVLPGQGAFDDCMRGLGACEGMIEALTQRVIHEGAPFLGICVGMQLLADVGLEHGETKGLGWIGGVCRRFAESLDVRAPHMGWNEVRPTLPHPVLDALAPARYCYFAHSYLIEPPADTVAARSEHGEDFASAVARDNIVGVQFHPEKSQAAGLALLERFVAWTGA